MSAQASPPRLISYCPKWPEKDHRSTYSPYNTIFPCISTRDSCLSSGIFLKWLRRTHHASALDLVGDQIWGVSDIYGYDNQMTASDMTDAQKKAVFTHEVGHALSLKHIYSPLTGVMRQGLEKALSPTDTDIGHLTLKWGY